MKISMTGVNQINLQKNKNQKVGFGQDFTLTAKLGEGYRQINRQEYNQIEDQYRACGAYGKKAQQLRAEAAKLPLETLGDANRLSFMLAKSKFFELKQAAPHLEEEIALNDGIMRTYPQDTWQDPTPIALHR